MYEHVKFVINVLSRKTVLAIVFKSDSSEFNCTAAMLQFLAQARTMIFTAYSREWALGYYKPRLLHERHTTQERAQELKTAAAGGKLIRQAAADRFDTAL